MIELAHVYYDYEQIPALSDITLTIKKGEAVSLIGANGCGKSTLLKLINGLIFPKSGTYRFNGDVITSKKMRDTHFLKTFHQKIGFVFQHSETQLFCSNVYDEIAFGPRQMGLDEKTVNMRVSDCLALLNIENLTNRQPYHLSGGEQKKVAICCVLSLNPDVLVLDEPMNGLDVHTQISLLHFFSDLHRSGKTIIISTHNLNLVRKITERSILFDNSHAISADLPNSELDLHMDLLKKSYISDDVADFL